MKALCKGALCLAVLLPLGALLIWAAPEFSTLWRSSDYWQGYGNSLLLTLPIVALQLLVSLPMAYALARWRGGVRQGVYLAYCLLTLLPCQVMLLPDYLICRSMGILHTRLAVILPGIFSPLSVFLLARQMQKVGHEQAEAASLDGASEWVIFRKIYLPQVRYPLYIAAGIAFLDCWSVVELPTVLLTEHQPLSVLLAQPDFPAPYAGSVLYLLPIVVIGAFAILNREKRIRPWQKSS
ncbi:MAG: carbohydrate ABC transporter permease [Clostridiales bacterium]|nr:carbohydrate ABC transporter permease [Candidatus Cacconaster stercorequi]